MRTLEAPPDAEQIRGSEPLTRPERFRSFDILANVESLRFDIKTYGYVLPETRHQVSNEQLSFLAEGIDRASRTTFVLKREGDDLTYFDNGHWRPYSGMLITGLEAAKHDAQLDPRRAFLVGWARSDFYHYYQMLKLKPGQQYVWESPYAHDQEEKYGPEFMMSCGLRSDRKMGFLYRAACRDDSHVVLETQTLDRSDDKAYAAVMDITKEKPDADLDDLVSVYDAALQETEPDSRFYAGRKEAELNENAWEQINANRDLVEYLLDGLENIARNNMPTLSQEEATKRHIYGVWALFKKRLDGKASPVARQPNTWMDRLIIRSLLAAEAHGAFREFAAEGRPLMGCGGSITFSKGEVDVFSMSIEDVFSNIFSIETSKTEEMKCVHCPLCKRDGVDATIEYKKGSKTITCSDCKRSKTYST